jgi:hypothetical protein
VKVRKLKLALLDALAPALDQDVQYDNKQNSRYHPDYRGTVHVFLLLLLNTIS